MAPPIQGSGSRSNPPTDARPAIAWRVVVAMLSTGHLAHWQAMQQLNEVRFDAARTCRD